MSSRTAHLEIVAWVVVLALAWGALAFTGYRSRDPDSTLHTGIEADQLERPARLWIAPEWAGHWNLQGPYREHPVGTFLPAVFVAKLGYPAESAGYAVNALYQVLALLLAVRLAARFVPSVEARRLLWLLQLLPIAFTYRVRANHEPGLLLFFLVALYATDRSRRDPIWCLGTIAGTLAVLLVKGLFAVLVPPSCAVWLLAMRRWGRERGVPSGGADGGLASGVGQRGERTRGSAAARGVRGDRWAWAGVWLSVVAIGTGAAAYEEAYRRAVGDSFLSEYLGRQLGAASRQVSGGAALVLQKLRNLGFYLARLAWFAFPWTLLLALAPWTARRRRGPVPGVAVGAVSVAPDQDGGRTAVGERSMWGALAASLAVASLWMAAFSLSDRTADRFIFPIYFLVGGAGALAAARTYPRIERLLARTDGVGWPLAPSLWLLLLFLQLLSPHMGLPFINR